MIIDCHMHYEPEMYPAERMLSWMEKHGIDKTALIPTMVEPWTLHNKIKRMSRNLLVYNLTYLKPLGRLFYDAFIVDHKGYFHLLWDKYRIYEKPDNSAVAEAVARYPDRFFGWIFVNPAADEDFMQEIEKWGGHPGMVGVKAHPFWHRYPVEKLDGAAAWCREHDRPLLIHIGSRGGSEDYRLLPERYPGIRIIYAHAGIPYFKELWAYIKDKEGLYVDLSSPYLNRRIIRMAVDFLGAEKCMYGTDGPCGEQPLGEDYDYGKIKGLIEDLSLPASDREMIFHANFEAVCGLG